jgi:hypothetical protein
MTRMSGGQGGFVSRFRGRINAETAAGAASVAAVFAAATALCLTRVTDTDLFWHLATGDLIRRTGHVPLADPFSFTAYGLPWVDIHWLYQVLVSYLYETTGPVAVTVVMAGLIVGLFARLYRRARQEAAPALAGALLLLAVLASQERFLTRPEVVSWWFLVLALAALGSAFAAPTAARRRLLLWAGLPLIVMVWVNVQALFILAPALTGVALAAALARAAWHPSRAWEEPGAPAAQASDLLVSLALQALAGLLNPAGARALRMPFEQFFGHLGGNTLLSRTIAEFRPTLSGYLVTPSIVAFVALAVLTLAVLLLDWRRVRLFDLLVAAATLYLALMARRNVPIFALAAFPILVRHVAGFVAPRGAPATTDGAGFAGTPGAPRPTSPGRRWLAVAAPLAVAAVAVLLTADVVSNRFFLRPPTERWWGLGEVPDYFPEESARFVAHARLPGQVFNSLWAGGYLIKAWEGDRRVFIDGRNDPYLHGVLETYLKAIADPQAFAAVVEKYQITAVLWPHQRALEARALLQWLSEGHGWILVHLDPGGAVFVRDDMMTPALVRLEPFGSGAPRDEVYGQLRRQLAERPFAGPPIREIALGEFFSVIGDPRGAEFFLGPAVQALPGSATLRQEYGLALERQGRRAEARAAYVTAARLDPGMGAAQAAIGAMALQDGDLATAAERLERAYAQGDRSARLFAARADLFERRGMMREAAAGWAEALAAAPANSAVLLEAARFEARRGDAGAAAALYDRLLALHPGDLDAARERDRLNKATAGPGGTGPGGD